MSNLNINNVDVQRILNVSHELQRKIEICSFLTFKTLYNILSNKEKIYKQINNDSFYEELEKHIEYMNEFRLNEIEIKEEDEESKEGDRTSESRKEEKFHDELNDSAESKEKKKNERRDLLGITEKTSTFTSNLARSTRNFCRKFHKEIEIIKEMKLFRMDLEITAFTDNFVEILLHHFIKKIKMTEEEELSDRNLNVSLIGKISELELQIKLKTQRLENFRNERQNFKNAFNNQINDIETEIKTLRTNTRNHLDKLEEVVNEELNKVNENNKKYIDGLKDRFDHVNQEWEKKKKEDEEEEKKLNNHCAEQEEKLRGNIFEYDMIMNSHNEAIDNLKNQDFQEKVTSEKLKLKRDKAKENYENYEQNFKVFEDKMRKLNYEKNNQILASEWIQGQFKGFLVRKNQTRKYKKILAPLKKPEVILIEDNGKGKNKTNRGGRGK
jgi:hypothetical protein